MSKKNALEKQDRGKRAEEGVMRYADATSLSSPVVYVAAPPFFGGK